MKIFFLKLKLVFFCYFLLILYSQNTKASEDVITKLYLESHVSYDDCGTVLNTFTFYDRPTKYKGKFKYKDFEFERVCKDTQKNLLKKEKYEGIYKDTSKNSNEIEKIYMEYILENIAYPAWLKIEGDVAYMLWNRQGKWQKNNYKKDSLKVKKVENTNEPKIVINKKTIGFKEGNKQIHKNNVNPDCSLKFYDLMGCDFSGQDLSNLDLSYSNFRGADLTDTNLSNTNLVGSFFEDAVLINTNFDGANLKASKFERNYMDRTNFDNSIMVNTKIQNSDLLNVSLINTDLSSAEIRRSLIKNFRLDELKYTDNLLISDSAIEESSFDNWISRDVKIHNSDLSMRNSFNNIELYDPSFVNNNMFGIRIENSKLVRPVFKNVWLDESNIIKNNFLAAYFEGSYLENANILNSNFLQASFIKTTLKNSNLTNSNFNKSAFEIVNLANTNLTNADLSNTWFRKNESNLLTDIILDNTILDGANNFELN